MDKQEILANLQQKINSIERDSMLSSKHDGVDVEVDCGVVACESETHSPNSDSFDDTLEDDSNVAFSRLVRLVAHRNRSCNELREKLKSEDFSSSEIEKAIHRACECNLVDDQRFADARIRYLINKGKGLLGIEQELECHNINLYDVSGWPDEYIDISNDAEIERALKLLQKKPSRSKNQLQGNYNKLIRQGYSTYVANQATNRYVRQIKV